MPLDAPAPLTEFAEQWRKTGDVSESIEEQMGAWMQGQISQLQKVDRRYWRGIIAELKTFRTERRLMPEGAPV